MVFASTFMVLLYNIILLIILQTIHKFLPTSSSLYNKLFSLGEHAIAQSNTILRSLWQNRETNRMILVQKL